MGGRDIHVETGGGEEVWCVEESEVGQGLVGREIKHGMYKIIIRIIN